MGELATLAHERFIEIGGMPILVRTDSAEFCAHAGGSLRQLRDAPVPLPLLSWILSWPTRGSRWKTRTLQSGVSRDAGSYSAATFAPNGIRNRPGMGAADSESVFNRRVLRILHSLILAEQGGIPVHAASADPEWPRFFLRVFRERERPRLAPRAPRVRLLTDEISYVRPGDADTRLSALPLRANWRGSARTCARRWPRFTCWCRVRRTRLRR